MSRRLPALLLPLVLGVLAVPAPAEVRSPTALATALDARVRGAGLPPGRFGIAVITRGAHPRVVYAQGHTLSLKPASVAKVLTAATALDLLGPAHVFTTRLSGRGTLDASGVLHGDLVVHGTGDPCISGRFHDGNATHVLEQLAQAARRAGIRRVTGDLVLDDGPFDREYLHPSWKESDLERWYAAPVAGLAFNDGCADVVIRGAPQAGRPATIQVPSTLGAWKLENRVQTTAKGSTRVNGLWVNRETALRVTGSIPAKTEYSFCKPVPDPLLFLGSAFAACLQHEGVHVAGQVRAARDAADRAEGALKLAQVGTSLPRSLDVMNKRSHNFTACLLHKACGAAHAGYGTWETGEEAVRAMLARRELDPQGMTRIVDGSGLSHDNRTTAATLALLLAGYEHDLLRGPLLYASLAEPGEDGTLRKRRYSKNVRGRLHAKTGTINGVRALAGYLDGVDGHPGYAFAILLNTTKGGRPLIDALVEEMAKR